MLNLAVHTVTTGPSRVKHQATKTYGDSEIQIHAFVYTIEHKFVPSHSRPIRPAKGDLLDSWVGHIACPAATGASAFGQQVPFIANVLVSEVSQNRSVGRIYIHTLIQDNKSDGLQLLYHRTFSRDVPSPRSFRMPGNIWPAKYEAYAYILSKARELGKS
jgi:hypothetical protein